MRTNVYQLKKVARQSAFFGAVVTLVLALFLPSASVFADSLNPLTERSLLLSSSAPGFTDTDGSGNSTSSPTTYLTYAPPGSGPNGKKTGETFTFKVSSDFTGGLLKGMSLQYCTGAAGNCQAPGNNTGDARTSTRETNLVAHPNNRSDLDVVGSFAYSATPTLYDAEAETGGGLFTVYVNGVATTGWTFGAVNAEDDAHSGALTGKNNYIYLSNTTGISPEPNDVVKVVFTPNESVYITNPGAGSFFVKINTYNTVYDDEYDDGESYTGPNFSNGLPTADNPFIVDGGVTVANVMTDSIHITTKVLETMSFSVGVENPDTKAVSHGTCDPMLNTNNNRLNMGNPDAEYSLEVAKAWDVYSYWRLSSNSSGGGTVYYSGATLSNTVGDQIEAIGTTKAVSHPGTEQFGLAFVDPSDDVFDAGFTTPGTNTSAPFDIQNGSASANYNGGIGVIGNEDIDRANGFDGSGAVITGGDYDGQHQFVYPTDLSAAFAFDPASLQIPRVIASQDQDVIGCSTGKMRYIGNIAPNTPAGIYTTKINYLAAPQY